MSDAATVANGEAHIALNPSQSPYAEGERVLIPQQNLIYEAKVRNSRLVAIAPTLPALS